MTERRIKKPYQATIYILQYWDGTDNVSPSGFITSDSNVAQAWLNEGDRRSFDTISGVMISHIYDVDNADELLKKQKALNKLTAEEQKLLGLT